MSTVTFTQADEVNALVSIDDEDPKEIKKVNNFIYAIMAFYDQTKSHSWEVREGFKTAMVNFYDKETHLLPIGLIPRVSNQLKARYGTKIVLDTDIRNMYIPPRGALTRHDVVSYAATLNLHNREKGFPIVPYEHQYKLVERAINGRRISLLACTSAGKSLSMCIMARYLVEREHKKVLIVVPSTNLVEQLFSDFYNDYGWDEARANCTLIHGTSDDKLSKKDLERLQACGVGEEATLKNITISTWQSLQNKPDKFFECFTAVLVDEAHSTRGVKLRDILCKCVNANDFKVGVSGTLPDDGIDAGYIESQLGRKEEIVRLKELVTKNILTPVTVNAIYIPYPHKQRAMICAQTYDAEAAIVTNNSSRRDAMDLLIRGNRITTEQNTVVLFKSISNLDLMLEFLQKTHPEFTYHVIKGEISAQERESIRKSIEYSTGNMILATYGCMKQGVNIKLLHNLVMAEPAKSAYMVVQSIGRIVRPHKDKKEAFVYDFVDDASYYTVPRRGGPPKLRTNYMMRHFFEREGYYAKDDIPVNEVRLDGIYEACIDSELIAEKKKKAAETAAKKKAKLPKKAFKKRFFI